MRLYFNELSITGQFETVDDFRGSLQTLMSMRGMARRYGYELFARRSVGGRAVTHNQSFVQTLGQLPTQEKTALNQWLTRSGPFWEDDDRHDGSTYFARQDEIVTDSSVGEVAWQRLLSVDARLVSLNPSSWCDPVVEIRHHITDELSESIPIQNYCAEPPLGAALGEAPTPLHTWRDMCQAAELRFTHLSFSADWMAPLIPSPFIVGSCERFLRLLEVLDQLKQAIETPETAGEEANVILAKYFAGDRAWFSDSSTTEINKFRQRLTFPLPGATGETLFCPYHGKVSTGVLRIHFSWPIQKGSPLYIVYAGPKLTK